uniref:Uncharacterized protein n=1 Tax=Knipowitschia caucasica TaxID=637954 RepID=A0AAV2KD28_KNICA
MNALIPPVRAPAAQRPVQSPRVNTIFGRASGAESPPMGRAADTLLVETQTLLRPDSPVALVVLLVSHGLQYAPIVPLIRAVFATSAAAITAPSAPELHSRRKAHQISFAKPLIVEHWFVRL